MKRFGPPPVLPVAASSCSIKKPLSTLCQKIALSSAKEAKEWVAAQKLLFLQKRGIKSISREINEEPSINSTFATLAANKKPAAPIPTPVLALDHTQTLFDSEATEPDFFDVDIDDEQQPQKQSSSEASKCTTQPFKSSKSNVSGGTLKILAPQSVPSSTPTDKTTTTSTLSAPVVGFGPRKPVFLHLLDLGLQLDQLCCQKTADQVTLDWIKESGVTDLTNIPNNPAAYDAFLTSPLPFHFDDNVLLDVHTVDGVRKHLV